MLTIFEAAKKGDIKALKHWVDVEKQDINQRDKFGMTPWLLAVQYADVVTLGWLVAHGADVSAKNGKFTALYYLVLAHEGKAAERPAKLAYLQELGIEFAHPSFALICADEWEKLKTISHENANYLKQTDHWGCRLLHYAVAWGNQAAVQWLLLEGGASIDDKDKYGRTALLLAAESGHLEVVQWLLQAGGVSIDEKAEYGCTALLFAARNGHLAMVQWLLLEGGASIGDKDEVGRTALLWAAYFGRLAVVQWLLQAGGASIGDKDKYDRTALLWAALTGHLAVVQWLLLEGGASIDEKGEDGRTALLFAAANGHLEMVQWLLQAGGASIGDKDKYGRTALLSAAAYGHLDTVKWLLLEGGASIGDKDEVGRTALLWAAYFDRLAVVQWLLLEGGASIGDKDEVGRTALLWAAYFGRLAVVQWLLETGGASIGEKDVNGRTALLLAVEYGHLAVVQWLLLEGGASITENNNGWTPFLLAAAHGHIEIVQWLLQAGGASIGDKDEYGHTALLLAAANGHLEMVQWLLQAGGASITEKDKKGWTALLLGARYGHLEVVRWLLHAGGASIAEKTNDDKTALYLAFLVEHYDIVLFLLDHQADISDVLLLASSLGIPAGDSTSKKLQAILQFAEALSKQEFVTALACIKEAAAISVNFTLGEGNTPLHILARETAENTCRNELITLLIKKGAHRYLLNAKAQTPIDIAKAQGDRELQGLLQTEFEKFYENNIVISQALMAKVLNGYLPEHGIPVVDMASRNYFLAAEFWPLILVEELHTLLGYCQMDIAICSPVQQKILEKLLVDFDEKVAAEEGSQVADYFLTEVEESELVKLIKSLQALNNFILKTHLQSEHALKTISDEIWIRDSLIASYELQPLSVLKDSREEDKATKIGELNQLIAPPSSKRRKLTDNAESDSNKFLVDKWQSSLLAAPIALPLDLKEKEPASEAKISSEDVNRDDEYLSFGRHR